MVQSHSFRITRKYSGKTIMESFKPFRMEKITDNKILVVVGKRNTGKTSLALDYLYHHKDIPFCTCVAQTEKHVPKFSQHLPSYSIHYEFTPELVKRFRDHQLSVMNKSQEDASVDPRGLLILEDCLAEPSALDNLKFIFFNGRLIKTTLLLTMQYPLAMPPALRDNVDYYFLFRNTGQSEKERIYKSFAGMFENFEMFDKIYEQMTENHGCMVIDNTSQSAELEDRVFYYKSVVRESFTACQ